MEHTEIRQMINGPESFTPDANPLLGEVPEVEGEEGIGEESI